MRKEIGAGLTLVSKSWQSTYRAGAQEKLLSCEGLHLHIVIKGVQYIGHALPVISLISVTAASASGPKAIR
jgi:hypothetical protein